MHGEMRSESALVPAGVLPPEGISGKLRRREGLYVWTMRSLVFNQNPGAAVCVSNELVVCDVWSTFRRLRPVSERGRCVLVELRNTLLTIGNGRQCRLHTYRFENRQVIYLESTADDSGVVMFSCVGYQLSLER